MAIADAEALTGVTRARVNWTPYLLVLPTLAFLSVFYISPRARAFSLAVTDPPTGALTWAHFRRMSSDLYFGQAVRFTLIITAIAVPLQVALGLAIALLVNTRFRGHTVFLYLTALPIGISDLAAGMIWLSILTERGYLNAALQRLGLIEQPVVFLTLERPEWLLAAIILTELWRATAIVMVILLAGLQLISQKYAQTAAGFGAGGGEKGRDVVPPPLRAPPPNPPVIFTTPPLPPV